VWAFGSWERLITSNSANTESRDPEDAGGDRIFPVFSHEPGLDIVDEELPLVRLLVKNEWPGERERQVNRKPQQDTRYAIDDADATVHVSDMGLNAL
jgi:hypothetical protein